MSEFNLSEDQEAGTARAGALPTTAPMAVPPMVAPIEVPAMGVAPINAAPVAMVGVTATSASSSVPTIAQDMVKMEPDALPLVPMGGPSRPQPATQPHPHQPVTRTQSRALSTTSVAAAAAAAAVAHSGPGPHRKTVSQGPIVTDDTGRVAQTKKARNFENKMRTGSSLPSVSSLDPALTASNGKPRLLPSGFAGIAAVGGGHMPMSAVKTESQPNKKRRRRPDPSELTEEQRLERRERNREHAKRSRIRKKFLLESLQDQLAGLRNDNRNLRRLIRERIPTHATDILTKCMTEESLLLMDTDMKEASEVMQEENGGSSGGGGGGSGGGELTAGGGAEASLSRDGGDWRRPQTGLPEGIAGGHQLTEPDYRLMLNLVQAQQNFTVSDPSLPDNPIVYASDGFLKLTGYTREQVIGRNCRFLQGPNTDQRMVDVIRKSVREGTDTSVCLLNYKADGTPFWNQFFVAALQDAEGNVVNFVGVQCEVNQVPIEIMREHAKQMAVWDI